MSSFIDLATVIVFTALTLCAGGNNVSFICESPQYAEYGQKGIIKCNFSSRYVGIYWYKLVNSEYHSIIRLEQQQSTTVPFREGYRQGKFTILSNGSLVISNVTTYDEQNFKVIHVDEKYEATQVYVKLLTTILPDDLYPFIDGCNKDDLCLTNETDKGELTCIYNNSRPATELQWYRQSHVGISKINGTTLIAKDGNWTYSSTLKINITSLINGPLIAFFCVASNPAAKSYGGKSVVVIDSTVQRRSSLNMYDEKLYLLKDSKAEIPCTEINLPVIFIWKNVLTHSADTMVFAFNGTTRVSDNFFSTWNVTHDGSLVLRNVTLEIEGLYSCTYFDGTTYHLNMKQVKVLEDGETTGLKIIITIVCVTLAAVIAIGILVLFVFRKRKCRSIDANKETTQEPETEHMVSDENKRALLKLLQEIVNLLMTYPIGDVMSQDIFTKTEEEKFCKSNVKMQIKQEHLMHKLGFQITTLAGLLKSPISPNVVQISGQEIGLTGVAIELSNEKLLPELKIWGRVETTLEMFISLQRNIAQTIALVSIVINAINFIRNELEILEETFFRNAHDQLERWSGYIKRHQLSELENFERKLTFMKKDIENVIRVLNQTDNLSFLSLDTQLDTAMSKPFNTLNENIFRFLTESNVTTVQKSSFYVLVEKLFLGDENGKVKQDVLLTSDMKMDAIDHNVKKTVTALVASGIMLRAMDESVTLNFLQSNIQNLLTEKPLTVAIKDAGDSMGKINKISNKMGSYFKKMMGNFR